MSLNEENQAAVRDSQMTVQISDLDKAIERLSSIPERLQKRLQRILRPRSTTGGIDENKPEEPLVPLAADIRQRTEHIESIVADLVDILGCIEL